MTLDPKDIKVEGSQDKPASGVWHNGPNNGWVKITHLPTMQSVTAYARIQHKARERALAVLEMLVSDCEFKEAQFKDQAP